MRSPPARHRGNLAILDMIRGGAALYVVGYHSVGSLTPSGLSFDTRGGSLRLLRHGNPLGLLGFGLYAVLAFFVLSGFVIHLRQAQHPEELARLGTRRWVADYGWRRSMRIYPPLVGAIALTAALGAIGSRWFADWPWAHGSLTDVRNLLLPVYGGASFGNDFALWSIAYELWFYVAYVPIILIVRRRLRMTMRLKMAMVLAGSLVLAGMLILIQDHYPQLVPADVEGLASIAIYFPAWAAGAFLAELYAAGVRMRWRRSAVVAAACALLLATFHSGNDLRPAVDLLWCSAIWLVIAVLVLGGDRDRLRGPVGRWAAGTASWSYSLYLVHLPVILFGQAVVGDGAVRITNPLVVLAVFLAAVAVGWLFSRAVERPSMWLVARPGGVPAGGR